MTNLFSDFDGYPSKKLSKEDEPELQLLMECCEDMFLLIEGKTPPSTAAQELLSKIPEGRTLKDKYVFGFYSDQNILISVLDLIENYKKDKMWFVGLLLIDPAFRNKGIGKEIIEFLKTALKENQAATIILSVVEQNKSALRFWQRFGFMEVERKTKLFREKMSTFIDFKLDL
ncbi:MAG: GNAT family N-acetyltransferase [Deltaproteobacteria bacterium]|nr:GNAT family N-acetyltransferase [Deltaproteobacteria bacterium]